MFAGRLCNGARRGLESEGLARSLYALYVQVTLQLSVTLSFWEQVLSSLLLGSQGEGRRFFQNPLFLKKNKKK